MNRLDELCRLAEDGEFQPLCVIGVLKGRHLELVAEGDLLRAFIESGPEVVANIHLLIDYTVEGLKPPDDWSPQVWRSIRWSS